MTKTADTLRTQAAYRGVHPVAPLDTKAVARCRDAMADGVVRTELRRRFGSRVYMAASAVGSAA